MPLLHVLAVLARWIPVGSGLPVVRRDLLPTRAVVVVVVDIGVGRVRRVVRIDLHGTLLSERISQVEIVASVALTSDMSSGTVRCGYLKSLQGQALVADILRQIA